VLSRIEGLILVRSRRDRTISLGAIYMAAALERNPVLFLSKAVAAKQLMRARLEQLFPDSDSAERERSSQQQK